MGLTRVVRAKGGMREGTVPSKRGPASIDGKRRAMLMGNKAKKRASSGGARREGVNLIIKAIEEYAEGPQAHLTTPEVNELSKIKAKLAKNAPISKEEGNRAFHILWSKNREKSSQILAQIKEL